MKKTKNNRSEIHYSDDARKVSVLGFEDILRTTAASIALIMFAVMAWQNPDSITAITAILHAIPAFFR